MLDLSQIIALLIFVAMFIIIVIGKVHRFIPALIDGGMLVMRERYKLGIYNAKWN